MRRHGHRLDGFDQSHDSAEHWRSWHGKPNADSTAARIAECDTAPGQPHSSGRNADGATALYDHPGHAAVRAH